MELTQKRVYEDIEEIKNTIECSKRKLTGIYKLFLAYGIFQGLVLLLNLFTVFIGGRDGIVAYFNLGVEMIAVVAVTGLFVKIYKVEKDTSNKYYLSTISIWGVIAVAMPFLVFAARLVIIVWGKNIALEALPILTNYKMVINMLLVCAATISVAYVIDKRWMVVLAIIVLFGYIVIDLFPQALFLISIKNGIQIEMSISTIFYYVANVLGYIGLGFLLLCQEKKSGDSKYTRSI